LGGERKLTPISPRATSASPRKTEAGRVSDLNDPDEEEDEGESSESFEVVVSGKDLSASVLSLTESVEFNSSFSPTPFFPPQIRSNPTTHTPTPNLPNTIKKE